MNDNIFPVSILAAGARLRGLTPRIAHLMQLSLQSEEETDRREADRGWRILDAEASTLRDYIAQARCRNAAESLVQVDALAALAEGMASDAALPEQYQKLISQMLRVMIGAAGVLSDGGGGLNEYTISELDDFYSRFFPVASRVNYL